MDSATNGRSPGRSLVDGRFRAPRRSARMRHPSRHDPRHHRRRLADPDPAAARAARRPRGVRGGLDRAAARPRLLGHRRAPGRGAADGHRPPDRVPDLRAARLARLGRPPAVRRAGLPDEPVLGDLRGGRGRRDRRSRPQADRLDHPRDRRRDRHGPDPGRLGDRDPRRGPFAPPGAPRDPALAPRHLGRARRRDRPPKRGGGDRRPRRPLPRRGGDRLRAGRRQPLADAAPGDPGRAVRARGRSADLAPRPAGPRLRRGAGAHGHPRLPRAAAACRAVPGRARLRHAEHLGRLPLHRPRRAVPGQPVRPVRGPAAQVRRARHADRHPVRHPRAAHPDRVHRRPPCAGRGMRC